VSPAADPVTGHPEQHQDRADHDDDDADRPDIATLATKPMMRRITPRIIKGGSW